MDAPLIVKEKWLWYCLWALQAEGEAQKHLSKKDQAGVPMQATPLGR